LPQPAQLVHRCCPVVLFASVVRTPPLWTCPPVETMRPVSVDVHVQWEDDGPAGTAYSDVRQLFMSSQSGVSGRPPPAAAGDHRTRRRKYTVLAVAEWFMMWKMPLQFPLST